MELKKLEDALQKSYSKDLCYYKVQDNWTEENKTFGMCSITALLVQDYFGGEIYKTHVHGISHHFNKINNEIIDLTKNQFKTTINYEDSTLFEEVYSNESINRYQELKKRVSKILLEEIDNEVHTCQKCQNLVDKFPNSPTVYLGKDNDIVLIGEAPANNGWRKSRKLWKDVNDKVLPSGIILQKLFDIIERDIFDTTFIESVKCFPLDRKNLKICSINCKDIMLRQLEILKPKLIITLGEFPTRNLLNFKFKSFSEVVGQIYEIDNYKVLPIYHPSPISPKSSKGNIPIFESLKDTIKS